jgi:hypothetical protein
VRAGGADAFEQDGCGFVVGVLGHEFAFEGFLEDGITEASATGLNSTTRDVEFPNGIYACFKLFGYFRDGLLNSRTPAAE